METLEKTNNHLLADIKNSIIVQQQMRSAYFNLADMKLVGEPHDKIVRITMIATYNFEEIEFDERVLQNGIKECKWHIRGAWKNLNGAIQKIIQSKTIEFFQNMRISDDIPNISIEKSEEGEGDGCPGIPYGKGFLP